NSCLSFILLFLRPIATYLVLDNFLLKWIMVVRRQLFPNRFPDVIRDTDILVVRNGLDLIEHFF
ncbi:MAG TPA: hypothetical protein PLQ69_05880, partial [Paludibacter sp.]|nr:hypothetical protein [Paludibacter sp.]